MQSDSPQTVDNAPTTTVATSKTKSSVNPSFRLKSDVDERLRATFKSIHGKLPDTDSDLYRTVIQWYIQYAHAAHGNADTVNDLTRDLQTANAELVTLRGENSALQQANRDIDERLSKHFLIEETPETREVVEAQLRRQAANKPDAKTLATWFVFMFRTLRDNVKNPKAELLIK